MSFYLSRTVTPVRRAFALVIGATALVLSSCASNTATLSEASLFQKALGAAANAEMELIAFRHDVHRHPELAGLERRTSAKVADYLEDLGYTVETGIGGYGVVARLNGDSYGPLIAFRADMDAVAGEALDPVPYASTVERVHHTCGHDVHTAIGIGLAEGFAAIQDDLPGSIMLIFQPAEEAGTGADAMLEDDLFAGGKPDALFAVHSAHLNLGELAVLPDGMMAGRIGIEVNLSGNGDIATAEKAVRDALNDVSDISTETMLSFTRDPFIFVDLIPQDPATQPATNVSGYVMSAGIADRPRVEAAVRAAVGSVQVEGVDVSLSLTQALEGVNNNSALVDRATAAIRSLAPDLSVYPAPGVVPAFSEDFGSFQKSVPGVMFYIGVNNPETGTVGFPHTPDFVADDAAIMAGTKAMLAAMIDAMETENDAL